MEEKYAAPQKLGAFGQRYFMVKLRQTQSSGWLMGASLEYGFKSNGYSYGPIASDPYTHKAPKQRVIVVQPADPYRYWKAGDLWPRTRGLLGRNAPGCPYRSC
jgi:hypothetical protein